ncbi:protein kinase [Actinoallomurus spadix]|uniref:Protein kinase domain-containing protein n=1 Tax=Actinoallomurus spadix TaxID=79912 RepID=A0ABN0W6I7_9ACTN|nr:serine/threonine-protein kinase [Actinoallomurus spadix]MCO5986249.1 protein kinase [Actinoallomurus spadix]
MPEGHPLRPGDPTRLGTYHLVGRLGEGTQGVVYLGRDDAGTHVAIKLLHARMAAHPHARDRFVRELDAAKKVARFCTAQVLAADLAGDRPYIVSEYVEGRSLRSQILTDGPRSGGALERLAISTLTALAAIHKAGIVHRDFNPQNVLLGEDGPRVIDFGIARALGTTRRNESNTLGTPAYMAPEQITGGELGPPVDMFAWGGTILFAATGRPPFGNDSVSTVMDRIVRTDPDLGPLPEPLRSVVAACLAKDPARRPTAQDAQAALLGQEPVGALAIPTAYEPPNPDPPAHEPPGSGPWAFGPSAPNPGGGRSGGTSAPHAGTAGAQWTAGPFGTASASAGASGIGGIHGTGAGPGAAGTDGGLRGGAEPVSRRPTARWAVGAGAATALVALVLTLLLWPDGDGATGSQKAAAVAATPSPRSSSPAPGTSPDDTLRRGGTPAPTPTPGRSKKKGSAGAKAGCRDYARAYGLPGTGTVIFKGTICRRVYSGTFVLADTKPKDGFEVCAQLRGHLTGSPGGFISTALISSRTHGVQSVDNGPTVRFGAKTKRTEDWVQVNAGRCRRSGKTLTSSWQTHERLATG